MSEQEIDAELCRWEPEHDPDSVTKHDYFWMRDAAGEFRSGLPPELFGALTGVRHGAFWRVYPTREAAFADLRQAIAASAPALADK